MQIVILRFYLKVIFYLTLHHFQNQTKANKYDKLDEKSEFTR